MRLIERILIFRDRRVDIVYRQYIGSMVYGKRVRPRIGVRQQLTAKLVVWIIVADCHEPLVKRNCLPERIERTRGCSIYMERYRLYADMEVLPDDAIADLLDRVTVWPDGRLEASLKFLNELPASAVADQRMKTTE